MAETLLGMANNCMGMEKYKEAISYLEELADIVREEKPKLWVALYKLGDCYANLQQYEQAIKYYDGSLTLCDETSFDDKAIVCAGMALVCRWNGNEENYQAYSSMAREIAAEAEDDFIIECVHILDIFWHPKCHFRRNRFLGLVRKINLAQKQRERYDKYMDNNSTHAIELMNMTDITGSNWLGDKAYGTKEILAYILEHKENVVIPPKSNAREPREVDYCLYKEHHLVECFFQKIKWFRRVATRHDKYGCKAARRIAVITKK